MKSSLQRNRCKLSDRSARTPAARKIPPPSTSLRILLVEDHHETLRIFARLLRHFGHEISVADCARSALQFVESKEFDLLLSDIGLPDGSGYEVVAQAKRKQTVKAVALTAHGTEEDIRRSKEAGFDFHFTKPVDFFELRTVLNQVGARSTVGLRKSPRTENRTDRAKVFLPAG